MLDYLRLVSSRDDLQVIIATHSPTIVESANFEELFLLRPAELLDEGENQLVQVATDEERLRFLREVFGTTANLTAMQPVVIVEGVGNKDAKKIASDRKLYRALHPGFDSVTLIAGGGKSECLKLLNFLDDALKDFSSELDTYALLDRDTERGSTDDRAHLLPVSMIENFLLDPESIWEAIQSVEHRTSFCDTGDVANSLDVLLTEMETDEVDRRIKAALGFDIFRPDGSIDQISTQAAAFASKLQDRFSDANVNKVKGEATAKVVELRNTERRREEFHGKDVMERFYAQHLHSTGMARNIFIYETARHARRRTAVKEFFDRFFTQLSNPNDVAS